jgi:hypothetical protein
LSSKIRRTRRRIQDALFRFSCDLEIDMTNEPRRSKQSSVRLIGLSGAQGCSTSAGHPEVLLQRLGIFILIRQLAFLTLAAPGGNQPHLV